MTIEELKSKVKDWTKGLPIEGETKQELKDSIKSRLWDLECELDQQANSFYEMVDKLNIPEE